MSKMLFGPMGFFMQYLEWPLGKKETLFNNEQQFTMAYECEEQVILTQRRS